MIPRVTDRSGCPGRGRHGTASAADKRGCTCPDAVERLRVYRKRSREGRQPVAYIDGTGTRRRYQALSAIGWPAARLAAEQGLADGKPVRQMGDGRRTHRETAIRFARLYERLQGTPGPSPITRRRAVAAGWAPPHAWYGINIDDPKARPRLGQTVRYPSQIEVLSTDLDDVIAGREHLYRLPSRYRLDVVERLVGWGLSADEISKRLHLEVRTVERYKAGIRARAQAGQLAEAG